MSRVIKNVVLVGAAGTTGETVLTQLIASGKFNIKVLRRHGSKSAVPEGIAVQEVDFESIPALTEALAGQDAVVCTVTATSAGVQKNLIDASIAAGVYRFIPSDFGADMAYDGARDIPIFAGKFEILDYLEEKAKTTALTWSSIATGAFLDWGIGRNFVLDFSQYKPTLIDGGDIVFSATTVEDVGKSVPQTLLHPEETRNRIVYAESARFSQKHLLALAQELEPEKPWQVSNVSIQELTKAADEHIANGNFDFNAAIAPYLWKSAFSRLGGKAWAKSDRELLGLKQLSDDDLRGMLRKVLN